MKKEEVKSEEEEEKVEPEQGDDDHCPEPEQGDGDNCPQPEQGDDKTEKTTDDKPAQGRVKEEPSPDFT